MQQGVIHVSKTRFPDATRPTSLADWQEALHLPVSYRVIEVQASPDCLRGAVWRVVIESDFIPASAQGSRFLPELTLRYRKEGDEEILDHMETRIWDSQARE